MSVYLPKWRQDIEPAELALQRVDTEQELEDAWFKHCDEQYPEGTRERKHLRAAYAHELRRVRVMAEQRATAQRLGRAS